MRNQPPALYTWTAPVHLPRGGLAGILPHITPTAAWIRGDEGMIGLGSAAAAEAHGASRFADLAHWWDDVQIHPSEHPGSAGALGLSGVPGSGTAAFTSITYSSGSAAASHLLVPQVTVGCAAEQAWVTLTSADDQDPATAMAHHGLAVDKGTLSALATTATASAEPVDLKTATGTDKDSAIARVVGGTHSEEHYLAAVDAGVQAIAEQRLEKLVLARDLEVETSSPLRPARLLTRLAQDYPTCWTYYAGDVLGATPEMLISVRGQDLAARVLAGTLDRSLSPENATKALLSDAKQRSEHSLAVDSLVEQLAPIAAVQAAEVPSMLQLPNLYHLSTDVTGRLKSAPPGAGSLSPLLVAERAHPTAAICGTPTSTASELIASLEELDRGPYAGPVGWIDRSGNADFGIALRGGVLGASLRRIRLFAGCGVVAGSLPDQELAESQTKMHPMLTALGL